MARIKLTPFYLFLIVLVVLVISVLFGYSQHAMMKMETFENQAGSGFGSSNQGNIPTTNFAPYSTNTSLYILHNNSATNVQVLYDIATGNVLVVNVGAPANDTQFLVINRNGTQQTYTSSSNGVVTRPGGTMANDLQQTPTVTEAVNNGSPEASWTYGNLPSLPVAIMYATFKHWTLVYIVQAMDGTIKSIYRAINSGYRTAIDVDTGVTGTSLSMKQSSEEMPPSGNATIVLPDGKRGHVISSNKYFNFQDGLIIKDADGNYETYSTMNRTGTNMATFDKSTHSTVIVSHLHLQNTRGALISVITFNQTNTVIPYNLFITARVKDNEISNEAGQHMFDGPSWGGNVENQPFRGEGWPTWKMGGEQQGKWNGQGGWLTSQNSQMGGNANDYILKTEIVPPVCPMCPTCNQSSCPLSVNASGNVVDCNGNIIIPAPTPAPQTTAPVSASAPATSAPSSTPSTFGQQFGSALNNTVTTAGNLADTAIGTAGNLANTTIGTAGNLASSAVGDVTGMVGGLSKDVTGLVGGVAGDVTGLAAGTIGTAAGLLQDAGGEAAYLANNAAAAQQSPYYYGQPLPYPYGQPVPYPYGQPVPYPYGQPMPPAMYGQGSCGMPYQPPSNFMPITNDFSSFGK